MRNFSKFQKSFIKVIVVFLSFSCFNFTAADWVYKGLTTATINALVVKDDILFAGTQISGVCVSTDYGDSWSVSLPNQSVWELAVFGSYILAGTFQHGVFVSKDNGVSWGQSNLNFTSVYSFAAYEIIF